MILYCLAIDMTLYCWRSICSYIVSRRYDPILLGVDMIHDYDPILWAVDIILYCQAPIWSQKTPDWRMAVAQSDATNGKSGPKNGCGRIAAHTSLLWPPQLTQPAGTRGFRGPQNLRPPPKSVSQKTLNPKISALFVKTAQNGKKTQNQESPLILRMSLPAGSWEDNPYIRSYIMPYNDL